MIKFIEGITVCAENKKSAKLNTKNTKGKILNNTDETTKKKVLYCFDGMIQTLRAIIGLAEDVFSKNNDNSDIFFMITLIQECLENLFALLRSRVPTNNNPSLYEFSSLIAKIITMKLFSNHSIYSNCEDDADLIIVLNGPEDNLIDRQTSSNSVTLPHSLNNNSLENEWEDIVMTLMIFLKIWR